MRFAISAFIFCFLCGCASLKVFEANDVNTLSSAGSEFEGQATVYAFREGTIMGAMWPVDVSLNKSTVGSVKSQTYVKFSVPPGEHILKFTWPPIVNFPDVGIHANFETEKTYYFLYSHDVVAGAGLSSNFTSYIRQLSKEDAMEKIATFKNRSKK